MSAMYGVSRRSRGASAPKPIKMQIKEDKPTRQIHVGWVCLVGMYASGMLLASIHTHCTAACVSSIFITVLGAELVNSVRFGFELRRVAAEVKRLNLAAGFLPVLIPAYRRPEYLSEVLRGMQEADGIREVCIQSSKPVLSHMMLHRLL